MRIKIVLKNNRLVD